MVERPPNIGSKEDKKKEKADESKAVEMLFDVLKGKDTDAKDGDEYEFGGGDEDGNEVYIVSSCMGERSFERTSTAIDDNGPAGDGDADTEQTHKT